MHNLCQANHENHELIKVNTIIGDMWVYDYDKYKGFDGYCTGQDDVSRTLINIGKWEFEITAVARKILEKGNKENLFIDVGSHIGWFSRLAQNYSYPVIAFEGDGENVETFKKNINKPDVNHVWFDNNLGAKYKFDRTIELLKIDIEGAEQYAIQAFIDNKIKNIIMEISPTFNDSYPDLIQRLVNIGFVPYEMDMTPFDFNYDFPQTNLLFRNKNA